MGWTEHSEGRLISMREEMWPYANEYLLYVLYVNATVISILQILDAF